MRLWGFDQRSTTLATQRTHGVIAAFFSAVRTLAFDRVVLF